MKSVLMIFSMLVLSSLSTSFSIAQAETKSRLMLIEDGKKIDVKELADNGELDYSVDRNSRFCFEGNVDSVLYMMKWWNKEGLFFSGGGGGYTIEKLFATKKGIVGHKINLVLRSEVTGEVENTIYILRCR